MKWLTSMIVALSLLFAAELDAQAVKEKDLLAGKASLNPAMGYIFASFPSRFQGTLIRVPDAEDWESYRTDWEKGYQKALKKYDSDYRNWEQVRITAREYGRPIPPKPVQVPPREQFSIGPIEARLMVGFGAGDEYLKDKVVPVYRYLTAVKPGTYIWYGPFALIGTGSCYCMGTVKFEVKAATITDTGDFLLDVARYDGLTMDGKLNKEPGRFSSSPDGDGEIGPDAAHYGIPQSLSAFPAVRAEFHAAGKMNNIFSIMVSRLRPIPGILGYRRGEVVDLRTGQVIQMQIAPFDPNAEQDVDDEGD